MDKRMSSWSRLKYGGWGQGRRFLLGFHVFLFLFQFIAMAPAAKAPLRTTLQVFPTPGRCDGLSLSYVLTAGADLHYVVVKEKLIVSEAQMIKDAVVDNQTILARGSNVSAVAQTIEIQVEGLAPHTPFDVYFVAEVSGSHGVFGKILSEHGIKTLECPPAIVSLGAFPKDASSTHVVVEARLSRPGTLYYWVAVVKSRQHEEAAVVEQDAGVKPSNNNTFSLSPPAKAIVAWTQNASSMNTSTEATSSTSFQLGNHVGTFLIQNTSSHRFIVDDLLPSEEYVLCVTSEIYPEKNGVFSAVQELFFQTHTPPLVLSKMNALRMNGSATAFSLRLWASPSLPNHLAIAATTDKSHDVEVKNASNGAAATSTRREQDFGLHVLVYDMKSARELKWVLDDEKEAFTTLNRSALAQLTFTDVQELQKKQKALYRETWSLSLGWNQFNVTQLYTPGAEYMLVFCVETKGAGGLFGSLYSLEANTHPEPPQPERIQISATNATTDALTVSFEVSRVAVAHYLVVQSGGCSMKSPMNLASLSMNDFRSLMHVNLENSSVLGDCQLYSNSILIEHSSSLIDANQNSSSMNNTNTNATTAGAAALSQPSLESKSNLGKEEKGSASTTGTKFIPWSGVVKDLRPATKYKVYVLTETKDSFGVYGRVVGAGETITNDLPPNITVHLVTAKNGTTDAIEVHVELSKPGKVHYLLTSPKKSLASWERRGSQEYRPPSRYDAKQNAFIDIITIAGNLSSGETYRLQAFAENNVNNEVFSLMTHPQDVTTYEVAPLLLPKSFAASPVPGSTSQLLLKGALSRGKGHVHYAILKNESSSSSGSSSGSGSGSSSSSHSVMNVSWSQWMDSMKQNALLRSHSSGSSDDVKGMHGKDSKPPLLRFHTFGTFSMNASLSSSLSLSPHSSFDSTAKSNSSSSDSMTQAEFEILVDQLEAGTSYCIALLTETWLSNGVFGDMSEESSLVLVNTHADAPVLTKTFLFPMNASTTGLVLKTEMNRGGLLHYMITDTDLSDPIKLSSPTITLKPFVRWGTWNITEDRINDTVVEYLYGLNHSTIYHVHLTSETWDSGGVYGKINPSLLAKTHTLPPQTFNEAFYATPGDLTSLKFEFRLNQEGVLHYVLFYRGNHTTTQNRALRQVLEPREFNISQVDTATELTVDIVKSADFGFDEVRNVSFNDEMRRGLIKNYTIVIDREAMKKNTSKVEKFDRLFPNSLYEICFVAEIPNSHGVFDAAGFRCLQASTHVDLTNQSMHDVVSMALVPGRLDAVDLFFTMLKLPLYVKEEEGLVAAKNESNSTNPANSSLDLYHGTNALYSNNIMVGGVLSDPSSLTREVGRVCGRIPLFYLSTQQGAGPREGKHFRPTLAHYNAPQHAFVAKVGENGLVNLGTWIDDGKGVLHEQNETHVTLKLRVNHLKPATKYSLWSTTENYFLPPAQVEVEEEEKEVEEKAGNATLMIPQRRFKSTASFTRDTTSLTGPQTTETETGIYAKIPPVFGFSTLNTPPAIQRFKARPSEGKVNNLTIEVTLEQSANVHVLVLHPETLTSTDSMASKCKHLSSATFYQEMKLNNSHNLDCVERWNRNETNATGNDASSSLMLTENGMGKHAYSFYNNILHECVLVSKNVSMNGTKEGKIIVDQSLMPDTVYPLVLFTETEFSMGVWQDNWEGVSTVVKTWEKAPVFTLIEAYPKFASTSEIYLNMHLHLMSDVVREKVWVHYMVIPHHKPLANLSEYLNVANFTDVKLEYPQYRRRIDLDVNVALNQRNVTEKVLIGDLDAGHTYDVYVITEIDQSHGIRSEDIAEVKNITVFENAPLITSHAAFPTMNTSTGITFTFTLDGPGHVHYVATKPRKGTPDEIVQGTYLDDVVAQNSIVLDRRENASSSSSSPSSSTSFTLDATELLTGLSTNTTYNLYFVTETLHSQGVFGKIATLPCIKTHALPPAISSFHVSPTKARQDALSISVTLSHPGNLHYYVFRHQPQHRRQEADLRNHSVASFQHLLETNAKFLVQRGYQEITCRPTIEASTSAAGTKKGAPSSLSMAKNVKGKDKDKVQHDGGEEEEEEEEGCPRSSGAFDIEALTPGHFYDVYVQAMSEFNGVPGEVLAPVTVKTHGVPPVPLEDVNCSQAPACAALGRFDCLHVANTCGECLDGFVGAMGADNTPCLRENVTKTAAAAATTAKAAVSPATNSTNTTTTSTSTTQGMKKVPIVVKVKKIEKKPRQVISPDGAKEPPVIVSLAGAKTGERAVQETAPLDPFPFNNKEEKELNASNSVVVRQQEQERAKAENDLLEKFHNHSHSETDSVHSVEEMNENGRVQDNVKKDKDVDDKEEHERKKKEKEKGKKMRGVDRSDKVLNMTAAASLASSSTTTSSTTSHFTSETDMVKVPQSSSPVAPAAAEAVPEAAAAATVSCPPFSHRLGPSECRCNEGYSINPEGTECVQQSVCPPHSSFTEPGMCQCNPGYTLNPSQTACVALDGNGLDLLFTKDVS